MWERVCVLTYVECLGSSGGGYAHSLTYRVWEVVGEGMRTHLRRGFGKWERVCTLTYVEGLGSNVGEGMRTHLRRVFGK